ncbi:hypothetical protein ACFL2H_08460 [Planctomycetota bacterium]
MYSLAASTLIPRLSLGTNPSDLADDYPADDAGNGAANSGDAATQEKTDRPLVAFSASAAADDSDGGDANGSDANGSDANRVANGFSISDNGVSLDDFLSPLF